MENIFNTSSRGYLRLSTSPDEESPLLTPEANVGAHQIAFITPRALPQFMQQATNRFDSFWQGVTGPSSSDKVDLSNAVRQILVDMGAGDVSLEAMQHQLPLQSMCKMFCGDSPPVRFGKDDKGNVVFEIRGKVDTDKLKGIAEDLKRIGMPAQGRSLLATLNLAPDGDVRNLPSAVRDVLVKMGAGPEHLAVAHDELPLKRLHQMFCGDKPPISIWHDDAGDVVFFTDPLVDTGEVVSIAKRLARCGMTAQGASLLVSLIVRGPDLDQDAWVRLLQELARLAVVPARGAASKHVPAEVARALERSGVDPRSPVQLLRGGPQHRIPCDPDSPCHRALEGSSARNLASQSDARQNMAPQLDLIDARLRKLPVDPLSRQAGAGRHCQRADPDARRSVECGLRTHGERCPRQAAANRQRAGASCFDSCRGN